MVVLFLTMAAAAAQPAASSIAVEGLNGDKQAFTIDQLRQLPQQTVMLANPNTGTTNRYEGPLLRDVLAKLAVPSGDKLRGDEMRDYVEITGRDGYRAVFALAELDPAFQDNKVVVAISSNGKPLDEQQGPVRLVAPQDKRPARSVRMVATIVVRRAP